MLGFTLKLLFSKNDTALMKLENIDVIQFLEQLEGSVEEQSLQKLILSRYQGDEDLQRINIRPVELKGEMQLSFVYSYKTRDITKNFDERSALQEVQQLLGASFRQANLLTADAEVQLSFSKKGKTLYKQMQIKRAADEQATQHNRDKHRFISLDRPFLRELGITDQQHRVIPAMSRKWRQINKFIEIVAAALKSTGLDQRESLHIADFGSGKAYLSFAVHDYLSNTLGLSVQVTGVELRQPLVDLCNKVVDKLALQGIQFEQGDVEHYQATGLDVMIALHACDTATDYAIHMGIRAGAEIVICSPCCHKQLRPQLQLPSVLKPMLSHGIHLGQQAEMLTDSLRALLLEANGYDTQVFEFVSLEHTSKNKMILASKRKKSKDSQPILQQIADIKQFYGIQEQCLESLLLADEQA